MASDYFVVKRGATALANAVIHDPDLSKDALVLLLIMLTLPPGTPMGYRDLMGRGHGETVTRRAMAELDLAISGNRAKSVDEFSGQDFDYVVTVCDKAGEACPYFPGAKTRLHQSFADPSQFTGTDEEIMEQVRQVRDQIRRWLVQTFPC